MSLVNPWECLATKKIGDDVSGNFASNASAMPDSDRFGGLADFSDNFNFYTGDQPKADANWIPSDVNRIRVNVSTNLLALTPQFTSASDQAGVFDLWSHGIFPSDTNWTLRLKHTVVAPVVIGGDPDNVNIDFGLSDSDQTFKEAVSIQSFIGIRGILDIGVGQYAGVSANSQTVNGAGADFVFTNNITVGTLFWELKRTSATTWEATQFTDSSYTIVQEKLRGTCEAGIVDLRFIKVFVVTLGSTDHRQAVNIDEVQFFNNTEGTTDEFVLHGDEDLTPFAPPNTTFPSPTISFDFTNNTGWVQISTGVTINTGAGEIQGWGADATDRRVFYDFLANNSFFIDDNNCTMEFKYRYTASTIPAHTIGIFTQSTADPDLDSGIGTSGWGVSHGTTLNQLQIVLGENVVLGTGGWSAPFGGIAIATSTDHFVRAERFNTFNYKLSIFSDPARTIHIAGSPVTGSTSINPLAMKVFHSSTASDGGAGRTLTGTLDDLEIFNGFSPSAITGGLVLDDDFSTYGTPVSADHTDTFDSATGWTTTDSTRVRIEDDQGFLFYMAVRDGSNDQIAFDLGATVNPGPNIVSDTEWLLSFKFTVTKLTTPTGDNLVCFVSLRNVDQNTGTESSSDALVFETVASTGGANLLRIRAMNNQAYPAGSSTAFLTPLAIGTLYVQLIRVSATELEGRLYADANYSDLIETVTLSISSGINSLRFLGVANLNSSTATGDFDVTIDDVEFWNGRTETCDIVNTLFTDNFTTDQGWVQAGTKIFVNTPTDITWDADSNGVNDALSFDLGTVLRTPWRVRFKFDMTMVANPDVLAIAMTMGLSSQDSSVARSGVQDFVGVEAVVDFNGNAWQTQSTDNTGISTGTIDSVFALIPAVSIVFVEIIRTSDTVGVCNIYSDSGFTTLIESQPITPVAGTQGLRFIKFMSVNVTTSTNTFDGFIDDVSVQYPSDSVWTSTDLDKLFVDPCAENIVALDVKNDFEAISFDLETLLSNDKWVMRWSLFTSFAEQNAGVVDTLFYVGMSSVAQGTPNTVQDFLGAIISIDGNTNEIRLISANNTTLFSGIAVSSFSPIIAVTDFIEQTIYYEFIRESPTLARLTLFSDRDYTFPIATTTLVIPANNENHQFATISKGEDGNSNSNERFVIDDVKVWDGIDVADSFGARRYLQLLTKIIPNGTVNALGSFNLDQNANGAFRDSFNGETPDSTAINRTFAMAFVGGLAGFTNFTDPIFMESSIYNLIDEEKLTQSHQVNRSTLGASNVPDRAESVTKWANLITKVSRIDWRNTVAGSYDTDTEGIVFGSDQ